MEILKRFDNNTILALVSIEKINPHEGIKEDYLAELTETIETDTELFRPILIANNDLVVLDGHHRYHSCKNLGCKRITAFLVDYFREDITVASWCPLILDKSEADRAFDTLKQAGFVIEEVATKQELDEKVDNREAAIGIITNDSPLKFFIADRTEGHTFSEAMKSILQDLKAREKLPVLKYLSDPEKGLASVTAGTAYMMIKVPVISKENVIKRGKMIEKYPPKTTKHTLPEIQDYHVSLDRLKKPNKEEDVEVSEEQKKKDEEHRCKYTDQKEYSSSIEWKLSPE